MFSNFIERDIYPVILEKTKKAILSTKKNGQPSIVEMTGPSGRGKSIIIDYLKEQIEKDNDNESIKNIYIKVDFSDTTFSNFKYSSLYYLVLINFVLSQYLKNKEAMSECREMVYLWNKFVEYKHLDKNSFNIEDGLLKKMFEDTSDNAFDYISGAVGNLLAFTIPYVGTTGYTAIKGTYSLLTKRAKEFFSNKVSNSKETNVEQKYQSYIADFKSSQDQGVSEFRRLLVDTITKAVQSLDNKSLVLAIDNIEYFSDPDVDTLAIENLINSKLPITYILVGRKIPFTYKNKNIEITDIGEISTLSENDLRNYFKKNNILVDGKEPTGKMLNELLSSTKGNIYWIKTKIDSYKDNRLFTEEDFLEVCKASNETVVARMLRCDNKTYTDEFKTRVLHGVLSIGSESLYYKVAKNCSERFTYTNEELGGYLKEKNNYEVVYEDVEYCLRKTIKEKMVDGDNNVIDTVVSIIDYIKNLDLEELDIHEAYGVVQAICRYDQEENILSFIRMFNHEPKYAYIKSILNEAVLNNYFSFLYLKKIRGYISNKEQVDYIQGCYKYICTESYLNKDVIKDFQDLHYNYKNVTKDTPEAIDFAIVCNEELIKRVLEIKEKVKFDKFDLIDRCFDNILGFIEQLSNKDYPKYQTIKLEFKEILKLEGLPKDLVIDKKEKLSVRDILDGDKEAEEKLLAYVKESYTKLQNNELILNEPITKRCDHLIHLLAVLNKTKENQNLVVELMTFGFNNRNDIKAKEKSRIYENFLNSVYEYVCHVGLTKEISEKLIEFNKEDLFVGRYSLNTLIKSYCRYRYFDQSIDLILEQKQLVYKLYKKQEETSSEIDLNIFRKRSGNINYVISENSCYVIYLVIYCYFNRNKDFIKLRNAAEKAMSSNYTPCFEAFKIMDEADNEEKKVIIKNLLNKYFEVASCNYFLSSKKDKEDTLKEIDFFISTTNREVYKNKLIEVKEKIESSLDIEHEISGIRRNYNDSVESLYCKEVQVAESILLVIIYLLSLNDIVISENQIKAYLKKICEKYFDKENSDTKEDEYVFTKSNSNSLNIKVSELMFILALKNALKESNNKAKNYALYRKIFDGIRFKDSVEYKKIKENENTEIILDSTKECYELNCLQIDKDNTLKTIANNHKYLRLVPFSKCVNKCLVDNLFDKNYSFNNLINQPKFMYYYFSHIAYNTFITFGIMNKLPEQYYINLFDIVDQNYLEDLRLNSSHNLILTFTKFVRSIAILSRQLDYGEEVLKELSQIDFETNYHKFYVNRNLYLVESYMPEKKDEAAHSLALALECYVNHLITLDAVDKKIKDILKDIETFVSGNSEYKEYFKDHIQQEIKRIKDNSKTKINRSTIIDYMEDELMKL